MKKMYGAVLVSSCILLAGCSSLGSHIHVSNHNSRDYLKAKSMPYLNIPPGLSDAKFNQQYFIPRAMSAGPVPVPRTPPQS